MTEDMGARVLGLLDGLSPSEQFEKIRKLLVDYIRPHMALDGKTPSEACGIASKEKTNGKHRSKMPHKVK